MGNFIMGLAVGAVAGCMGFYWMLKNDEARLQDWLATIRKRRQEIEDRLRGNGK